MANTTPTNAISNKARKTNAILIFPDIPSLPNQHHVLLTNLRQTLPGRIQLETISGRKELLLVGRDKISNCLLAKIVPAPNLLIARHVGGSAKRAVKLVMRRRLRVSDIGKMFLAELMRPDFQFSHSKIFDVSNNADLAQIVRTQQISRVYLFRVGLIINSTILKHKVDVYNVHCANIHNYGGLAAIRRAL
ncbi:MAG: hypothetical protein AAGC70_08175, partial [Pseudomonadota bacterium]